MPRKGKGVVFDSTPNYGVGQYEDAKAKLKHQNLMQDYEELQRETGAMKSKLEAANKRKLILAAEVRFLRKRYEHLMKSKNMASSQEHMQKKNPLKVVKSSKEPVFITNEASQHILPKVSQPKKKKQYLVEQAVLSNAFAATTDQSHNKGKQTTKRSSTPVSNRNQKEKKRKKEAVAPNMALLHGKSQKESILCGNDMSLRNPTATFDLNEDGCPNGKEAAFPSRAPIFDLNEILTGDEDLGMNVEAAMSEEAKKNLIRGINDEQQNDLKLAVCRNSGEGSSRVVGKRKISWQDPLALRV
ncbi:Unknown protein [Striga hermonthica]|uniref:Uncharacterized protein n=1 Tax=Striga hermonthica TaxID=68872 RepID=A0A9N7MTH5_STRHE|nr:Unknown protein [Striga hermonthica]